MFFFFLTPPPALLLLFTNTYKGIVIDPKKVQKVINSNYIFLIIRILIEKNLFVKVFGSEHKFYG